MIRLLLALGATVAGVVAASAWLERRGVEVPEPDVTPAVRTVQLAADALNAALEAEGEGRAEPPDPPSVVEEELDDSRAMPFVESPPPDDPPSPMLEAEVAPPPPAAPEAIDADASAALVRRLLALHARMRSGG